MLSTFKCLVASAILALAFAKTASAQTTLAAGDIAFTGYNSINGSDAGDSFSFILLRNITLSTTVIFTDRGWDGTTFAAATASEGSLSWRAENYLPAGTQVTIGISSQGIITASTGTVTAVGDLYTGGTGRLSLSTAGDQILAFQGTFSSGAIYYNQFIAAVHANLETYTTASAWDGSGAASASATRSALPPGLTDGVSAVALFLGGTEYDNAIYSGELRSTWTQTQYLAAINNRTLWQARDTTSFALPPSPTLIPEMVVKQASVVMANNETRSLVSSVPGTKNSVTFEIGNTGTTNLTSIAVAITGTDASAFRVSSAPGTTTVAPSATTNFTVSFEPTRGGSHSALVTLTSSDAAKSPFTIQLLGTGLTAVQDTDGDGMSDAAEFQLAPLGFNWNSAQTSLVASYYNNARFAGLYTRDDLQALKIDAPVISRDSASGRFKLSLGLQKSADLTQFTALPFSSGTVVQRADGKIEFSFAPEEPSAFFRLECE